MNPFINLELKSRFQVETIAKQLKQHADTKMHQNALEQAEFNHGGEGEGMVDDNDVLRGQDNYASEEDVVGAADDVPYSAGGYQIQLTGDEEEVKKFTVINASSDGIGPAIRSPSKPKGSRKRKPTTVSQILTNASSSSSIDGQPPRNSLVNVLDESMDCNSLCGGPVPDDFDEDIDSMTDEDLEREYKILRIKKLRSSIALAEAEVKFFNDLDEQCGHILAAINERHITLRHGLADIKDVMQQIVTNIKGD